MCHNLEWKLGQNEKYANTNQVLALKSLEKLFAFAKSDEFGKVLTIHL